MRECNHFESNETKEKEETMDGRGKILPTSGTMDVEKEKKRNTKTKNCKKKKKRTKHSKRKANKHIEETVKQTHKTTSNHESTSEWCNTRRPHRKTLNTKSLHHQ